jgi:hypothetical protein
MEQQVGAAGSSSIPVATNSSHRPHIKMTQVLPRVELLDGPAAIG